MADIRLKKRTTVRIKMATMRAGFRLAERAAPALGAWAAERVWFQLPKRRERVAPADGTAFEVRSEGSIVRGRRWGEGPPVYLVHGWGGHAGQLTGFAHPLVEHGFSIVSFDAPSHGSSDPGRSGPERSHAVEFGKALDAVAARFGPAHTVIAHSMGAVSTLLALKHGWLATQRLALVAPMATLDRYLMEFAAMVGFGPRTRSVLDARIRRRVGLPVEEFDLHRLAGEIERPSLLVVHDRGDRETSYDASVALVDEWPGAGLIATNGLGHRRLLRDPEVVRAVTEFVTSEPRTQAA